MLTSLSSAPSQGLYFRSSPCSPSSIPPFAVATAAAAAGGDRSRSRSPDGRKPGFISVIDRAMVEEEEYRRARAEVQRKGAEVEGYLIEGISVGGHETCVIVPSLNVAFDIGRCPSRAVHQDFLFIIHVHLDHIGGLPMYLATRGLYNLKPPTVFVPPSIKEDVEELLEIHRRMSQVELKLDLVALDVEELLQLRESLNAYPEFILYF